VCSVWDVYVLQTDPRRVSTVTLDWSEIMDAYDTADTVVRNRWTKYVMK